MNRPMTSPPSVLASSDDRQLWRQARELQCALDGVVIREGDAIEPALIAALDQRIE